MDFENINDPQPVDEFVMEIRPCPCCSGHGKIETVENDNLKNRGRLLSFRCPMCGSHFFLEWLSCVLQATDIHGLHTVTGLVRGIRTIVTDEAVHDGYFCLECGYQLRDRYQRPVMTQEELSAYLEGLPVNREPSGA